MNRRIAVKKNKRVIIVALIIGCLALSIAVLAAYFAKGVFKDVFVNKMDYFSANVLYNIESLEADKRVVGSAGSHREISVYNYDVTNGDVNNFDVTFDVYVWLDGELPSGKKFELNFNGNKYTINNTEHTEPLLKDLTLQGGKRSTVSFSVDFGFTDEDNLSAFPNINIVAVPNSPKRMTHSFIGAIISPTHQETFTVSCAFEKNGIIDDYAAFVYRVTTIGNAPDGDKIVIKWNSDVLTLIRVNQKGPDTVAVEDISEVGFDKKIVWEAKSNHTDTLAFFRNTEGENNEWITNSDISWDWLYTQISTEHIKSGT